MKKKTWIYFLFFILLLSGCDRVSEPQSTDSSIKINAKITIISGNSQEGQGDGPLGEPIIIRVTDLASNPLSGVDVRFEVVEGSGDISGNGTITTDSLGRASIQWTIGSGYNGLEITLSGGSYHAPACYCWAQEENASGIHITRTIASFRHVGGVLYEITFHGNYTYQMIQEIPHRQANRNGYHCSLFAVFGNPRNQLLGRSFDNPAGWDCLTLITRIDPEDGYASIAPMRMRDIGFGPGTNFDLMRFTQKSQLIQSAVNPPDGINEQGLVAGLANVTPQPYYPVPDKESISCVMMIRKILDQAATVDEAADIARQYNINRWSGNTLDIHAIVADATDRSVILDPAEGEFKVIPNTGHFQVVTNSPVYNVSIENQRAQCPRFQTIYDRLASENGILDDIEAMSLLQTVGNRWTEWSAVYNISKKTASFAINFSFETLYDFPVFLNGN